MRSIIIIETPDGAEQTASEIAVDYAELIRQSAADDKVQVTVTTDAGVLWRDEKLISDLFNAHMRGDVQTILRAALEGTTSQRALWCPVCKIYHVAPIGEQTDAGVYTRACPRRHTDEPLYYGSPIYTGDR